VAGGGPLEVPARRGGAPEPLIWRWHRGLVLPAHQAPSRRLAAPTAWTCSVAAFARPKTGMLE
jgi:hypothetical protein